MSEPQTTPSPTSGTRKVAYSCGTFTIAAALTLSLLAIAAAVLILVGILP